MLKGKGSLVMQRFALTTSHFGQFSQHLRRVADIFSSFQCEGLESTLTVRMSEVGKATDYHSCWEKGCDNNHWKAVTDVTALCISHTPPLQLGGLQRGAYE